MRRLIHAVLVIGAGPVWLVAYVCLALCALLVVAADRVLPHARIGNCWSYVAPRWLKHGGYIGIRIAPGVRFLWNFLIPHAIWIRELPETADIRQTSPINRCKGRWFPWYVFYFPFKVTEREGRAASTYWADLSQSESE